MLAHCGYVGLCWPMLAGQCGPSLGCGPIVRPMSADLEAVVGPC